MQPFNDDSHLFKANTFRTRTQVHAEIKIVKHSVLVGALGVLMAGAVWGSEPAVSAVERYTPASAVCGYIELKGKIDSSSSGAWDSASKGAKFNPRLTFVDAFQERILEVGPGGQLQTLAKSGLLIPRGATPSRIRANDGLLVVQDQAERRMLNLTSGSAGFNSVVYRTPEPIHWLGPEGSIEGESRQPIRLDTSGSRSRSPRVVPGLCRHGRFEA